MSKPDSKKMVSKEKNKSYENAGNSSSPQSSLSSRPADQGAISKNIVPEESFYSGSSFMTSPIPDSIPLPDFDENYMAETEESKKNELIKGKRTKKSLR